MRAHVLPLHVLCLSLTVLLTLSGCAGSRAEADADRPVVVVTTTILGDLTEDIMRINTDRIAHAGQNVLVERVHRNT